MSENKPKSFSPVILFYDYGDPLYGPVIQQKKREVSNMLQENGRMWSELRARTRSGFGSHRRDMSPHPPSVFSHNDMGINLPSDVSCAASLLPILKYSDRAPAPPSSPPPSPQATVSAKAGKRRGGSLPKLATFILKEWLTRHKRHPYPTEAEKQALASKTGLTMDQIAQWFVNARRRILLPMMTDESNDAHEAEFGAHPYGTLKRLEAGDSRDHTRKPAHRSASKTGIGPSSSMTC
ncbi:hypothetical protein BC936DRAFT_141801 [Jimgerdemannia flammicorona]|uniref:Homeobox domain-containing protein n=1 Tax=Jimgerdemannia flammicorona TaxID=994334 RepID=A0A433DFS3_9FUNG|nr:hypothetical protein BC936DRAFT_141801 [Jimgerdemannia flammicorona]